MISPKDDPDIIVRPATAADRPAIRQLVRSAGINPLGLHWPRFRVAAGGGAAVIGCGQVKPHRDGSLELASIAVAAAYRRRGVARAIIRSLQQLHGPPLWLTCLSPLVPFYEQFGFAEMIAAAEMPAYYRRARQFMRLMFLLRRDGSYLAVMRWPGNQ